MSHGSSGRSGIQRTLPRVPPRPAPPIVQPDQYQQYIEISDDDEEEGEIDAEDSGEDEEEDEDVDDVDVDDDVFEVLAARAPPRANQSNSKGSNLYRKASRNISPSPARRALNGHFVQPPVIAGYPNPQSPESPVGLASWGDFMNDEYFDDDDFALLEADDLGRDAFLEAASSSTRQRMASTPSKQSLPQPEQQAEQPPEQAMETRIQCVDQVLAVFPGICREHVSKLYETVAQSSNILLAHILDKMESGEPYPKASDGQNSLKRKRDIDEDEQVARKYGAADRVIPNSSGSIRTFIRNVLSLEFPETPMIFLDATLIHSGYRLFSAYRVLEEAERGFDPKNPPYNKIKHPRRVPDDFKDENLEAFIISISGEIERVEILRELQAARKIRKKGDDRRHAERQAELEEEANLLKAKEEGTMSECECCFSEFPLNRMVHCENDQIMHWFCRGCARQTAETEIGNSKYELLCMSMDGCDARFSVDQRSQFLDVKTIIALERNEQEAVLRMAGIENLASCPFCPFAAEYPPVEIDREFRCQAPDCEKVSCRVCKLESHIPKSCEEHAKESGLSIRRQIEEAMSAALIRKCNKCGTPFVKEEGCNKMTCTRNGCFNVQCYVCSKSCSYDHFDDKRRGGKAGNCPLFESVEERHDEEVKKAERDALEKIRAEHPEYTEDDLKVKMSENVMRDDEQRKANNFRIRYAAPAAVVNGGGQRIQIHGFPPVPAAPGQQVFVQAPPPIYRPFERPVNFPPLVVGPYEEAYDDINLFAGLWDNLPEPPAPPMPAYRQLQALPPRLRVPAPPPAVGNPFVANAQAPAAAQPAAFHIQQPGRMVQFGGQRAAPLGQLALEKGADLIGTVRRLADPVNMQNLQLRLHQEEEDIHRQQQFLMLHQQQIVDQAERIAHYQQQQEQQEQELQLQLQQQELFLLRLRPNLPQDRQPQL